MHHKVTKCKDRACPAQELIPRLKQTGRRPLGFRLRQTLQSVLHRESQHDLALANGRHPEGPIWVKQTMMPEILIGREPAVVRFPPLQSFPIALGRGPGLSQEIPVRKAGKGLVGSTGSQPLSTKGFQSTRT